MPLRISIYSVCVLQKEINVKLKFPQHDRTLLHFMKVKVNFNDNINSLTFLQSSECFIPHDRKIAVDNVIVSQPTNLVF